MRIVSQRTYLQLAILATITILVFYSIVKQFDLNILPTLIEDAAPWWIVAGTLIGFATSPFLNTSRWQAILRGAGYDIGFKKIFFITMKNWPFMVLPGRVGDLLKSYPLRHEVPINHSMVSIVIEKIIDVLSLIALIMAGSLILNERTIFFAAAAIGVASIIAVGLTQIISTKIIAQYVFAGKTRDTLLHFDHVLRALIRHKKYLFAAVGSSLGNWITNVIAVWCFYQAFHLSVPFSAVLAYLPLGIFIGLIPVTVAGMGTRDAALIQFFGAYASPAQSLGVGIFYSLSAYWLPVLVGLAFIYSSELKAFFGPRNTGSQTAS